MPLRLLPRCSFWPSQRSKSYVWEIQIRKHMVLYSRNLHCPAVSCPRRPPRHAQCQRARAQQIPVHTPPLLCQAFYYRKNWKTMTEPKRPKEVTFTFPQPPDPFPPSQRSGALIGPSGVGKTTTAISMLMGPYRNVYSRVYVFPPSCTEGVDPSWGQLAQTCSYSHEGPG